ncbi:MAG TPA: DNA gyrase inhibitor YacG [bacterium]
MLKYSCPVCHKHLSGKDNRFFPFCSERCKLIDLGNWASGEYYIPGKDTQKTDKDEDNGIKQ